MFTSEHFIWIGICAVFVIGFTAISVKCRFSLKTAGYIMSLICAFSEISKMMSEMQANTDGGMNLNPKALPFHLCSLMLFGVLFVTFGKEGRAKDAVINFLAVMGTLGSVCAILIPTNGTDFANILSYQCFIYHGGLLWFSLYLIASNRARLGIKTLGKNLFIMLSLTLVVLYVNSVLSVYGTNFMYLVRPPMKNLPFLTLDYGWYAYFLNILFLALGIITLFHLPFIVLEHKMKKAHKAQ
ncbi:MAG: YwaF family protein [Clostridia bacterium]|nr:YwaF family protein [Clostridia bacterium]